MRGNNIGDVDAGEKSVTKYGRQTKRNAEYTRNGLRNATTKNLCASSFFFCLHFNSCFRHFVALELVVVVVVVMKLNLS